MKISFFSLVLLIVAAIDSIRTLPSTAIFGSSLLFFFLIAAAVFLIPISFISAEFSSRFPEEGGIFHWIRRAFGEKMGALAVWLQWINTMVWYPTMLIFIAGTAAHLINPALAQNKVYLIGMMLFLFWTLTVLNLRGIQVSAKLNSFCGTIGTLLPMGVLILLSFGWIAAGHSSHVSFSWESLIPSFQFSEQSSALTTIMASLLGMELAGAHIADIENPQKNFPKAIGISVLILLASLILGALSVAVVIPKGDIHFADGVMQTFSAFLNAFQMPYLIPVLALLIVIGCSGGSINWLISPAKGLLQAAERGFLPAFFTVKNKHGVSVRILVSQAILVSFFGFGLVLIPSINAFYWLLMSISTGLYMLMYMLLFLAALKLGRPSKESYQIPRGLRTASCLAGLAGCAMTLIAGFQPPAEAYLGSAAAYGALIAGGFALMIAPIFFLWSYQKRNKIISAS